MEETFEIEVVAKDAVWTATFTRRPGPASWADAAFVWIAIAESPAKRRHASAWALSGILRARLDHIGWVPEAALEWIVTEYRRRFDELVEQQDPKIVIEQEDYNRLTSPSAEPIERIGREIDELVFAVSRRLPTVQEFGKQGGTAIELGLPQPEVWMLESIVVQDINPSISKFYELYERTLSTKMVAASGAAGVALDLRRLVRLGGVARRAIWTPPPPAVEASAKPSDAPELRAPSVPGYELGEELGKGGFGVVYRAKDAAGVERAVKLLAPIVLVEQGSARERFHREARALGGMRHPNIVQYLHLNEGPSGWYMVMELIRGANLHRWSGEQSFGERIRAIADALDGLQYMHDHNVVHRDLKPSNIVVEDASGRSVIVDFGLAWLLQDDMPDLKTRPSTWSAAYAPPESLAAPESSRVPTHDIYSMGVVLYEVLAGNLRGRIDGITLETHSDELKAIDPIVAQATAPLATRFKTAKEFADALRVAANPPTTVSVPAEPSRQMEAQQLASEQASASGSPNLIPKKLDFSDTAIFFHDRFCDAFPGVRGSAHYDEPKEVISRLNVLLRSPLRGTVNPIWELAGLGSMPVTRFTVVEDSTVLLAHYRLRVRDMFACRGNMYYRDFVVLRWEPDEPTGLYPVVSPEEIAAAAKSYGRVTEEYAVWNGELITRDEYDDNAVFRGGKSIDTSSAELQVRQLARGALIITGQSSAAHNRSFDAARSELLKDLAADRIGIDQLIQAVNGLEAVEPRHRR